MINKRRRFYSNMTKNITPTHIKTILLIQMQYLTTELRHETASKHLLYGFKYIVDESELAKRFFVLQKALIYTYITLSLNQSFFRHASRLQIFLMMLSKFPQQCISMYKLHTFFLTFRTVLNGMLCVTEALELFQSIF